MLFSFNSIVGEWVALNIWAICYTLLALMFVFVAYRVIVWHRSEVNSMVVMAGDVSESLGAGDGRLIVDGTDVLPDPIVELGAKLLKDAPQAFQQTITPHHPGGELPQFRGLVVDNTERPFDARLPFFGVDWGAGADENGRVHLGNGDYIDAQELKSAVADFRLKGGKVKVPEDVLEAVLKEQPQLILPRTDRSVVGFVGVHLEDGEELAPGVFEEAATEYILRQGVLLRQGVQSGKLAASSLSEGSPGFPNDSTAVSRFTDSYKATEGGDSQRFVRTHQKPLIEMDVDFVEGPNGQTFPIQKDVGEEITMKQVHFEATTRFGVFSHDGKEEIVQPRVFSYDRAVIPNIQVDPKNKIDLAGAQLLGFACRWLQHQIQVNGLSKDEAIQLAEDWLSRYFFGKDE